MKDDNHNNEQSEEEGDDPDGHSKDKPEHKFNKCETLDEGTFAFMHWLNSNEKKSLSQTDNPIVLLKFVNDKQLNNLLSFQPIGNWTCIIGRIPTTYT